MWLLRKWTCISFYQFKTSWLLRKWTCISFYQFKTLWLLRKWTCISFYQFKTKNKPTFDINIVYDDNSITPVTDIKFLGIYLQDSINWSCHIEYIIPKLSSACYVMRSIKPIMPINTLKTVYYSHFNAIITYGPPFWGNSPHSTKIFKMRKRMVRIMMGYRNGVSRRSLFKKN